jgi:PAS domain S-box-containing protein
MIPAPFPLEQDICFRALFDLLPEPMLLVNLEGRIHEINVALAQRLHRVMLAPGTELRELATDPPAIDDYLRRCARSGQLLPGSVSLRDTGGAMVKYQAAGAAFRFAGSSQASAILLRLMPTSDERSGFIALNQKIRELNNEIRSRQRSEIALQIEKQTLKVTLASIADAVIVTDADGGITFLNSMAEEMVGHDLKQACGRTLFEVCRIVNESTLAPAEDPVQKLRRTGIVGVLPDQAAVIRRDGTVLPIDHSAAAVRLEGKIIGTVYTFRDISAGRQYEQALVEAGRRKDEFLAMLAHELRNPLAAIGNAAELLSRMSIDDRASMAVVGMIKRQGEQLTRIVDDLLDVSRITQGRVQLRSRPVDLSLVITQAAETVEAQLRQKKHKLSVTASTSSEPLYVNGDLMRLVQSVANVLANAAKYTQPGGEISVHTRGDEGSTFIEISDSGAGISPELLPRIFDLFVQSEQTLDRSQGGLGIGLAVVKRLIEMHKGEVTARSDGLGQGSTFVIRLPRIDRPETVEIEAVPSKSERRRVLIVDDNADAADSLAMLLQIQGHETHVAYSGEDALASVEAFRPDIGLLDIGLPRMDGYELSSRLRAMPQLSGLRLIALTGYGQAADRQRARAVGFEGHLVKPVGLSELERALGGHCPSDDRENRWA